MVVFDNTFLSLLLHPDSRPPEDPATGKPFTDAKERIEFLLETLQNSKEKILVPTPVLTEVLVIVGESGPEYLAQLSGSANFEIAAFDQIASVELAASIRQAKASGDKKQGSKSPWAKIKFDAQIVAIAKVRGADVIYSDDHDVANLAARASIKVFGVKDLPKAPAKQSAIDFASAEKSTEQQPVAKKQIKSVTDE